MQALRPYMDAAGGASEEVPFMSEPQMGFRRLDESLYAVRSRLVLGIRTEGEKVSVLQAFGMERMITS